MTAVEILLLALVLDAIVGDPDWLWRKLPHPAALMGRAIHAVDVRWNAGKRKRLKGTLSILGACIVAGAIGWAIARIPASGLIEVLLVAVLLAQSSLAKHVGAVARGLRVNLDEGRNRVALIVGRDPDVLDENGVARSAIESAAENFSDAVVAPAFWFLLLGLPGILIYKLVNTADSMIGYRTDKYEEFGWFAARLDDVLNWIPARLSGLLICAVHGSGKAVRVMLRDAPLHRSPNAGWPEAAMASVVGVAIAGPRTYDGVLTTDPFVNAESRRDVGPSDIQSAVKTLWRGWAGLIALLGLIWLVG